MSGPGSCQKGLVQEKARTSGKILLVKQLKTDTLESLPGSGDGPHLGNTVTKLRPAQLRWNRFDTVTDLDSMSDLFVSRVRLVPGIGHTPLVHTKL